MMKNARFGEISRRPHALREPKTARQQSPRNHGWVNSCDDPPQHTHLEKIEDPKNRTSHHTSHIIPLASIIERISFQQTVHTYNEDQRLLNSAHVPAWSSAQYKCC